MELEPNEVVRLIIELLKAGRQLMELMKWKPGGRPRRPQGRHRAER